MKRKRKTAREIFIVICLFLTIFLAVLFAFGRTEIPAVVYMSVCTACLFGGVAAIQERVTGCFGFYQLPLSSEM